GDLFDSSITYQNYPLNNAIFDGGWSLRLEDVQARPQTNYPLTILISSRDIVQLLFSYNSTLLDESYVRRILQHFVTVLKQFVSADSGHLLGDIVLIDSFEREQLVNGLNVSSSVYPADETILDLFARQVKLDRSSIALVFEGRAMSYGELDAASNRLGHYLRGLGVGPESLVGICLDRGMDMIVGILGILKSGGAYVPIDPEYPLERISYMVSDSGVSYVVSSAGLSERLPATCQVIELDGADRERIGTCSSEAVASGVVSS
ncbi:AMP-binding protein, partial [Dyadobacter sp. OTU695]|uniref:AMP-binding protein n=1 Tax=Dyadobacter sp. OTU695 TaxID=3043860 RepID=UPI00313E6E7D